MLAMRFFILPSLGSETYNRTSSDLAGYKEIILATVVKEISISHIGIMKQEYLKVCLRPDEKWVIE